MDTKTLRSVVAAALFTAVVVPNTGMSAPVGKRMQREATELFALVLKKMPSPKRCQYDLVWSEEGIPDYVARSEFHLTLRAGLIPPLEKPDIRTVLDPARRNQIAFCSEEGLKAFTAERVSAFEQDSGELIQIDRRLFSFPIFDDRFSKAVIVVTQRAIEGRARVAGRIKRIPAGAGSSAEVYHKTNGRWRFVRSIQLGVS